MGERLSNRIDDKNIFLTPRPSATNKIRNETRENVTDSISNSDESLGIISIQSEDVGPYIDNLQLKDTNRSSLSFVKKQRSLASKTLQNRESKVFGLPSRFLRPSDISGTSDSCINISNGSTVNESDLLKSGSVNNTSTPRSSVSPEENTQKVDIAGSMAKMSLEIRNSDMSLESAFQKIGQEFQKVRDSISTQSDVFKPGDQIESQLLADEASWKKEKELPVEKIDFTVDNFDTSKMSISTLFRQRSEDISNIIPSNLRQSCIMELSNIESLKSARSSLESIPLTISSIDVSTSSEKNSICKPQDDSLSISKIAQILQGSEETPTKVLDYLLKHHQPSGQKLSTIKESSSIHLKDSLQSESSTLRMKDVDSGNFHPSTLTSDKENFDSMNIPIQTNLGKMSSNITKSLTSIRTGSSLSDLPEGKLPIETTHCELVWGCVKPGKSEARQFTLRNRSSNKLRLQCTVSGPSFRILQEKINDSMNSFKFILHAREAKSLSILFSPLSDGAAVDEIIFSPCDSNLQQTRKQSIKLFGYGGTSHLEFNNDNIVKDSANRHWLNFENIFQKSVITKKLAMFNKGTLASFAFVDYVPKHYTLSKPTITPNILILPPNEGREVSITFTANGEDLKYIQNFNSSVFELGVIKVLSGPEPTRGRIRRMCRVAMEKQLEVNSLGKRLQQMIHGEAIPHDVVNFKESINSLRTLLQSLSQKEIVLMVEKDLDSTLVPALTNETSMFQSFLQESTFVENKIKKYCTLEPPSLILTPPSKMSDFLFLTSESESPLKFQISAPEGLTVTPVSGHIKPYSNKILEIKIVDTDHITKSNFKISMNIGNEVLCTDVKIIFM